jgi:hypothetical protein
MKLGPSLGPSNLALETVSFAADNMHVKVRCLRQPPNPANAGLYQYRANPVAATHQSTSTRRSLAVDRYMGDTCS